jgi:tetratricopeptide (TPR) repeat protein
MKPRRLLSLHAILFSVVLTGYSMHAQQVSCDLQQPPNDPAAQAFRNQDYAKAYALYAAAVKQNPHDADAVVGAVRSLLEQQQVAESAALAERSSTEQPRSAKLSTVLGEVRYRQGFLSQAVAQYQKAMQLDPCLARTRYDAYRLMRIESMDASAYHQLQVAHQLSPADADIDQAWTETLPLDVRAQRIAQYLATAKGLSPKDVTGLKQYLGRLQALLQAKGGVCRLASAPAAATKIPFKFIVQGDGQYSGLGFDVKVNQTASARLELDTGASGIILNHRTAQKAGLVPVAQQSINGLGDQQDTQGYWAFAKDFNLGGLEFKNCLVEVSDKKSVVDVDGLVGTDVFENYHVQLDFPMHVMTLSPLPPLPGATQPAATGLNAGGFARGTGAAASADGAPSQWAVHYTDRYIAPEMQSWSPFARIGHQILLNGTLNDQKPRLFLMDTGSDKTLLSEGAARSIGKVHHDESYNIKGLSGNIGKVYTSDNVDLTFANLHHHFHRVLAINMDKLSASNGTEVSGILGMQTLVVLTVDIDYRDGLIHIAYDPKHGTNINGGFQK